MYGLRLNMVRYRMAEGGPPLNSLPDTSPKERNFYGAEIWENLRSKQTMLSYWRRGLTEVLKDHEFDEAEGKKVINFLLSIFRFAILAAKEQGPGGTVKILYNLVPNHLNLVSWRRILVGMNLVLEEPDTNNDIRLIGVTLSKKHKREIILQTLDEFSRLLVLLKDCNWQVLQTILDMDQGYPMALLEILDYCKDHDIAPVSKQKNLKILYEIDLFAMRQLGFYRANPTEPVSWERPASNAHLTFISILYALYGSLLRDLPRPNNFHSLPFF
ncbi:uncharacterized protein [Mytilus edulis]|uniref:uncharacterized protein isoform X4 n=1 Tax=Mytilus edulis TaxID=6550 RepID=UPI0039EE38AB